MRRLHELVDLTRRKQHIGGGDYKSKIRSIETEDFGVVCSKSLENVDFLPQLDVALILFDQIPESAEPRNV